MHWSRRIVVSGGVLVLLAFTLAPFWVMVSTSLQDQAGVLRAGAMAVPVPPAWQSYPQALTTLPFGRFFLNTIVFSGAVVMGQLVTSVLAGYAFARMPFAGRRRVFALLLGILFVPAVVLLIPRFLLLQTLGWVDTLGGLISAELVSVWGIFLMRQAFQQLPAELEEAARLDGAGTWTIFREVALPAVRPALVTLALFAFLDSWRAYLWPLVATRSLELRTIEVGVATAHGFYFSNWPYQMVAAVAAALPLLLVFVVAQRHFVRGFQLMGFK
ncbi:MAG: carbohydrate ABC transporter permease [Gemmatimonadales bacterium]